MHGSSLRKLIIINATLKFAALDECGWTRGSDGVLDVVWETDENIKKSAKRFEYVMSGCKCKKGCWTRRCKCRKTGMKCGPGCRCTGCGNVGEEAVEVSEMEVSEMEEDENREEVEMVYASSDEEDAEDEDLMDKLLEQVFGIYDSDDDEQLC